MSIRLRRVNGILIALCAARSVEKPGDVYLDDNAHHALAEKFARDWSTENAEAVRLGRGGVPRLIDEEAAALAEQEESNNPNRTWWDRTYGQDKETL